LPLLRTLSRREYLLAKLLARRTRYTATELQKLIQCGSEGAEEEHFSTGCIRLLPAKKK